MLSPKCQECPDVENYKWQLNPVWHSMLYSCTHMTTVGVKGLIADTDNLHNFHKVMCRST